LLSLPFRVNSAVVCAFAVGVFEVGLIEPQVGAVVSRTMSSV